VLEHPFLSLSPFLQSKLLKFLGTPSYSDSPGATGDSQQLSAEFGGGNVESWHLACHQRAPEDGHHSTGESGAQQIGGLSHGF
jgi:hypothetical protein